MSVIDDAAKAHAALVKPLRDEITELRAQLAKAREEPSFDATMKAVLWELPRTHKGFRCMYQHDEVKRAFETARAALAPAKTEGE